MSPRSTNLLTVRITGCTRFVGTPSPVQQHNHECLFWKKRWYLALSVNAFSTASVGLFDVGLRRVSRISRAYLHNRAQRTGRNGAKHLDTCFQEDKSHNEGQNGRLATTPRNVRFARRKTQTLHRCVQIVTPLCRTSNLKKP